MLNIARMQLLDGIVDARFIFLSILIVLAFISNGLTFSETYIYDKSDYDAHVAHTNMILQKLSGNLQSVAVFNQEFSKPPSPLNFIANAGDESMPNVVKLNAFNRWGMDYKRRNNEMIPKLPSLDWVFIIGILVSLLTILLSYDSLAGEKKQGTLKLLLSYQVSRISLFAGKYLGILFAVIILLVIGIITNLLTIMIIGGPAIAGDNLLQAGWAFLLSFLFLSFFILTGMAVSSLTHKPAVSLVVLLVIWVFAVLVIPGVGKLVSEQLVKVPSQASVREEERTVLQELWESRERFAGVWNGDPFHQYVPQRARLAWKQNEAYRKIHDLYFEKQVEQISFSRLLSSVSPFGILSDGLQVVSGTGYMGVRQLHEAARDYQTILNSYVVNVDMKDPGTPHLVYGHQDRCDTGVFSQKPIAFESIPSMASHWTSSGLAKDIQPPIVHLILLLSFNLFSALVAFLAIAYYDPR